MYKTIFFLFFSLIYGFCSKETTLDLLKHTQNGTFLLRFSESEIEANQSAEPCGYLTVALIEIDPLTGSILFLP